LKTEGDESPKKGSKAVVFNDSATTYHSFSKGSEGKIDVNTAEAKLPSDPTENRSLSDLTEEGNERLYIQAESFGDYSRSEDFSELQDKLFESLDVSKLVVGSEVEANYGGKGSWYSARIVAIRNDGTFDIEYDYGDNESRVKIDRMRKTGTAKTEAEQTKKEKPQQKTESPFADLAAEIAKEEGDQDVKIPVVVTNAEAETAPIGEPLPEFPADPQPFQNLAAEVAAEEGATASEPVAAASGPFADLPAEVAKEEGDQDVKIPVVVTNAEAETAPIGEPLPEFPADPQPFQNLAAEVAAEEGATACEEEASVKDTYQAPVEVAFAAAVKKSVSPRSVTVASPAADLASEIAAEECEVELFSVGTRVEVDYRRRGKYYPAVVYKVRSDGTYDIDYDDGEKETRVESDYIREIKKPSSDNAHAPAAASVAPPKFHVDDIVEANYRGRGRFYRGKVIKVRHDGTYDVDYDDGEHETLVKSHYIRLIKAHSAEPEPNNANVPAVVVPATAEVAKAPAFNVGDKVEANFAGRGRYFPGKIFKVRDDGTYDVDYDDGETEKRVQAQWIRLLDPVQIPSIARKWQQGDRVEVNYRGKGKWFPGKVKAIAMNGTYCIDYDDGEYEENVKEELVRKQDAASAKATIDASNLTNTVSGAFNTTLAQSKSKLTDLIGNIDNRDEEASQLANSMSEQRENNSQTLQKISELKDKLQQKAQNVAKLQNRAQNFLTTLNGYKERLSKLKSQ
jgi:hypothetical protein